LIGSSNAFGKEQMIQQMRDEPHPSTFSWCWLEAVSFWRHGTYVLCRCVIRDSKNESVTTLRRHQEKLGSDKSSKNCFHQKLVVILIFSITIPHAKLRDW
jgi:hypothetical protein